MGSERAFRHRSYRNVRAKRELLINLLDSDSDNDGVSDANEVAAHTDPADPKSKPSPPVEPIDAVELELLPVASVDASEVLEPHIPSHTIDGDMATRWSVKGDGQWIMYDIGAIAAVGEVAIAWVHGDQRKAAFSIEGSLDGNTWEELFSGDSSGKTNELESYPFDAVSARYVRIVGYGNSSNGWNNMAEVELYGLLNHVSLPAVSVRASDAHELNIAVNTTDGDLNTRWAAKGDGQWIMYDVGTVAAVHEVAIAWAKGDERKASFSIEVSLDGNTWEGVFNGNSSGDTSKLESYPFDSTTARFVRLVGHGNSSNMWNNMAEVELYGQLNHVSLPVASVRASDAHEQNVAVNTTDGDMNTRWAAKGDGQWIMYDIGVVATVGEVAIAWAKGDERKASFSIEVSRDGSAWKGVFRGDSSGKTTTLESYPLDAATARFVRIVGHGNASNAWNNIVETEIYGMIN